MKQHSAFEIFTPNDCAHADPVGKWGELANTPENSKIHDMEG